MQGLFEVSSSNPQGTCKVCDSKQDQKRKSVFDDSEAKLLSDWVSPTKDRLKTVREFSSMLCLKILYMKQIWNLLRSSCPELYWKKSRSFKSFDTRLEYSRFNKKIFLIFLTFQETFPQPITFETLVTCGAALTTKGFRIIVKIRGDPRPITRLRSLTPPK